MPSVFSEELNPSDKSRPFAPLDRQNFLKKRATRAEKSAFFRLKKSDFSKGRRSILRPRLFFRFFFGGGVFPCDTDVGARQNGTCCCGRSRENVAQSSLASSVGKPVLRLRVAVHVRKFLFTKNHK